MAVFVLCFSFFRTEARRFWVGLNKRDPEYAGAWEWSDGSPVSTQRHSLSVLVTHQRSVECYRFVFVQVVTSFIDDKSEEDDRRDCAAYSDLTNTFMPQLCDSKHEWVCKLSRGKRARAQTHSPALSTRTCCLYTHLHTHICITASFTKLCFTLQVIN